MVLLYKHNTLSIVLVNISIVFSLLSSVCCFGAVSQQHVAPGGLVCLRREKVHDTPTNLQKKRESIDRLEPRVDASGEAPLPPSAFVINLLRLANRLCCAL